MTESTPADADTLLRAYLAGRDAACPSCGYNLRDLREPRCPECGDELSVSVRGGERRIAGAIAGLIPLSGVACFDLGMSGFFLYMVLTSPYPMSSDDWRLFWFGFLGAGVIAIALLTFWVRNWRRITRAPRVGQIVWAGVAWLVPVLQIVLLNAIAHW